MAKKVYKSTKAKAVKSTIDPKFDLLGSIKKMLNKKGVVK